MRSRKYKVNQSLSHSQILAKVKRQMYREQQYQKTQENLFYLNNSFNNNIQFQQILIDLAKGKKKNIKLKELKMMYTLFSDNMANMCIFQKIVDQELKKTKMENAFRDGSIYKWSKQTKRMMEAIEEQQAEVLGQIPTNNNLTQQNSLQLQNEQESSKILSKNYATQSSSMKSEGYSFFQQSSFFFEAQDDNKQVQFLVKRIYCRLIEKILAKITFYTMNAKFLASIAVNMLEFTRNLETMIRRLNLIKDLRLLQQTILKVYKQNLQLENKIFEMLVDGGYIISIDEFYRINGVDAVHKQVYERKSRRSLGIKYQQIFKQTIEKDKQMKKKNKIVKKDHIVRVNNQINQKYKSCVSQIKQLIEEDINHEIIKKTPEKKRSTLPKTKPMSVKKPSRFGSGFGVGKIIENKEEASKPKDQQDPSQKSMSGTHSPLSTRRKMRHKNKFQSFTPQFSKIIKKYQSANRLKKVSVLSEKFMELNEFEKGQRKQSNIYSQQESIDFFEPIKKEVRKKSLQQVLNGGAISKLLKIYQTRNSGRYSIQSLLSSELGLPPQLKESLKQELIKLQNVFDDKLNRKSTKKLSLNPSQTPSDIQTNQMNIKQEDDNEDYFIDDQNFTKISNEFKKIKFELHKGPKNPLNSKEEPRNFYYQDNQAQNIYVERENIIEKKDNQQQAFILQKLRQSFLIKLSRDGLKRVKTPQKIKSQNLSIFTIKGVENLSNSIKNLHNAIKNYQMPLKNEKLKRIAHLKKKQKLSIDFLNPSGLKFTDNQNLNEIYSLNLQKSPSNDNSKTIEYQKIYKKAYQSSNTSINGSFAHKKTIQQVIEDSNKKDNQAFPKRIKQQKGRSLHKFATIFQERINKKQPNLNPDMFRTFHPRWMNRTLHANSIQMQPQNLYKRDRKIRTTIYQSSTEPVSPRAPENKQNSFPFLYQVYDVRYQKKVQIPK